MMRTSCGVMAVAASMCGIPGICPEGSIGSIKGSIQAKGSLRRDGVPLLRSGSLSCWCSNICRLFRGGQYIYYSVREGSPGPAIASLVPLGELWLL